MSTPVATRIFGNALAIGRLVPAFLALGLLRHVLPLDVLARWAWRSPRRVSNAADARRIIARAVRACALAGAPDRNCLQRSLLLYRELSRAGADPVLAVGFRHANGRVQGHAWVVVGGRAVAEPDADMGGFVPALTFGRQGRLATPAAVGQSA